MSHRRICLPSDYTHIGQPGVSVSRRILITSAKSAPLPWTDQPPSIHTLAQKLDKPEFHIYLCLISAMPIYFTFLASASLYGNEIKIVPPRPKIVFVMTFQWHPSRYLSLPILENCRILELIKTLDVFLFISLILH